VKIASVEVCTGAAYEFRIVICIHYRDRLTGAVAGDRPEHDAIEAIREADLGGRQTDGSWTPEGNVATRSAGWSRNDVVRVHYPGGDHSVFEHQQLGCGRSPPRGRFRPPSRLLPT